MEYKVYDKNGTFKKAINKTEEKELGAEDWLKGVTCFVINEKGEILIEIRANKGLTPRKLDLCSGHIDGEETPTQAMIRELGEELKIGIDEAMNVIKLSYEDVALKFDSSGIKKNFFITFYCLKRSSLKEIEIQKEEIDKIVWLPLEEAFALIKSGRTKFPTNYDYDEIFQEVRDVCNGMVVKTRKSER